MRLIVTDNSTAARTMADRLGDGKAARREVHRIPVFDTGDAAVIGLGGLLMTPHGNPPVWSPARRAPANALRVLARSAETLVLATGDALLAVQARDVACEGRPLLLRAARVEDPDGRCRHVDDLAAHARAAALEADAVFAAHIAPIDAELTMRDLATLGLAARRRGSDASLARLAERGYLVGEPPWRSPAGELVCASVDRALLGFGVTDAVDAWVDAVARGTLARAAAVERVRGVIGALARPARPEGLDAGRLVGPCPECGDWMGGARERLRCMGCGLSYRLPNRVEALAVPGAACEACGAPLILPVVRGRRDEPRCPDWAGCPTRLDPTVAA